MFPDLKNEVVERFEAVERHLRYSPRSPADIAQTARGLAFVEIYAVYEHAIRQTALLAAQAIASHRHRFSDLQPSLAVLFLDAELNSLRDCSEAKVWRKRLDVFNQFFSRNRITAVDVVPHDGSHFRYSQVQMLFEVLGIKRAFVMRRRHPYMIDEIVRHRNSIAHGHETPLQIGRQFSREDVARRIRLMRSICLRIVSIVQEFCDSPTRHRR